MNILKALLLLAAPAALATVAEAQLWKEFAHPSNPHVDLHDPDVPIAFDGLFADEGAVKLLPVLVVLLDFQDLAAQPQHTPAFYADMVFGIGGGPWSSMRPSVAQTLAAGSNGRLMIVPALESFGTPNDGIVGWVTAQCPPGVSGTCGATWYAGGCGSNCIEKKRAEGVRRADPFLNYGWYDSIAGGGNGNGFVTSGELTVLVINAEDGCCDDHDAVGHTDPPGCTGCAGGNARNTDPKLVNVDGVYVYQIMAGMTEGAGPNVAAHEMGHQTYGLGDLYSADGNPWADVGGARQIYCFGQVGCTYNDACSAPVPMSDGDLWRGSTETAGGLDLSSCATGDTKDVWFSYTPAVSATVTFTTCHPGTEFDTTLALYDGCLGMELDCNDDDYGCTGNRSTIFYPLAAGFTYWVRVSGYNGASGKYELSVAGGQGQATHPPETWFPPEPNRHSLMSIGAGSETQYLYHLDPWAKMHLGFLKPQVVTHDGTYSVWAAEPQATFAQQAAQPQALVVYDPLRATAYKDYFLLENRTFAPWSGGMLGTDSAGLALWLIDETPDPGLALNLRQAVRLQRRDGPASSDVEALWDGSDPAEVYDVTPTSTPTNTAWNDSSTSFVEMRDVSAAGAVMTVFVQMPPLFVDPANLFGPWVGTAASPFAGFGSAVAAVAAQDLDLDGLQDGRRTLRLAPGSYSENPVVTTPVLITTSGGPAVVGTP